MRYRFRDQEEKDRRKLEKILDVSWYASTNFIWTEEESRLNQLDRS